MISSRTTRQAWSGRVSHCASSSPVIVRCSRELHAPLTVIRTKTTMEPVALGIRDRWMGPVRALRPVQTGTAGRMLGVVPLARLLIGPPDGDGLAHVPIVALAREPSVSAVPAV